MSGLSGERGEQFKVCKRFTETVAIGIAKFACSKNDFERNDFENMRTLEARIARSTVYFLANRSCSVLQSFRSPLYAQSS